MLRKYLFILASLVCSAVSAQQTVTTFILLRHAEKGTDSPTDPDLSDAGKARAESLVKLLKKTKVDAIYSTPYKRTRNTVSALAVSKGLTTLDYSKLEEFDAIIQKFAGGTIVVCGHSNTTPALVNYLTGQKDEYKTFDDSDFGNVVVVSVIERGKNAKVTWLSY